VGATPLWQGGGMGQPQGAGISFPPSADTNAPWVTQGQSGSGPGAFSTQLPNAQPLNTTLPRPIRERPSQSTSALQELATYSEERSAFEDYVLTGIPGPLSFDIRQFGYDVFRQPGEKITPDDNLPVGQDYIVGPGDEVRVNVWGSVEGQWQAFVGRDGTVSFPKIGTIMVAGQSYERLRKTLEEEMHKFYTDFHISVTLGQLRTIKAYATGNFLRPGEYTISSFATLVNVLFQSGGPSKNGTMRAIELKRGNKTVAYFDAYELLL
jgi:polysaccharide export outer membrane protein